jgi:putative transposase
MRNPFRYFNSSPEVIRLVVVMYIRYPLSLRQVEDILFERGIDICHETVRYWWNRFGPMFAAAIRKRRLHHRSLSQWRWHLDEVFVRINGETHYLWRAVDHEGEVLEVFATKRRDRRAALKFLKRTMKRYGRPRSIVTDQLSVVPIGDESNRQCCRSGVRSVAQQSRRKFPPAVPTTRTSDAEVQGRKDPTEICNRPRINPQPLQPRPSSQPPRHLQTEPFCRPGRVASAGGLNPLRPAPFAGPLSFV